MKSTFKQMPSRSQRSQQLSKEERRKFSNHQLNTTQLSPLQPKNNSKSNPISTKNQLKIKPLCFNHLHLHHHHHHLLSSLLLPNCQKKKCRDLRDERVVAFKQSEKKYIYMQRLEGRRLFVG